MYEASFVFYLVVFLSIIRTKNVLLNFLFIIYTVQFWALFFNNDEVVFWVRDQYTFTKSDPIAIYLLKIFSITNLGFFASTFFVKKQTEVNPDYVFLPTNKIPNDINFLLIIVVTILILLKINIYRFDLIFNGVDLAITALLSICFLSSISKKSTLQIIFLSILLLMYIYSQLLTTDRNFIGIFISVIIFYATFFKMNFFKAISALLMLSTILFIGVYISIYRAGVDVDLSLFIRYFYYNSWMSVFRPVIDMLIDENLSLVYLYGKSYLDLGLSFAPSFFYGFFDTVKPYVADNPAQWYAVIGGGGMHAVGVALKNFGLTGVFLQSFIFSMFTIKLEEITKSKNNLLYYAFFICISITYMKSIWYSMLDFVNAITLFLLILIFIKVLTYLLPIKKIKPLRS